MYRGTTCQQLEYLAGCIFLVASVAQQIYYRLEHLFGSPTRALLSLRYDDILDCRLFLHLEPNPSLLLLLASFALFDKRDYAKDDTNHHEQRQQHEENSTILLLWNQQQDPPAAAW